MDAWRVAFTSVGTALALAACTSWHPSLAVLTAAVDDARFVNLNSSEYSRYYDLVNLATAHGSVRNAYFDVFVDVQAMKIRMANDTTLWTVFTAKESVCDTRTTIFEGDACAAKDDKPLRVCMAAVYVGELGIHKSTQYYKCKDSKDTTRR